MKVNNWKNLHLGKCPLCGHRLCDPTRWKMILCSRAECNFSISVGKCRMIRESMAVRVKGYPQGMLA